MKILCGLFAILCFCVQLCAQEFRGAILGRVTDPSGAAIPNASVEAINTQTGTIVRGNSNEVGNYQLSFLLPGTYTVRVQAQGFKTLERTGVQLATSTLVTVDAVLEVGDASSSVTVSDTPPLLETANGDLGTVVTRTYIGMLDFRGARNVALMAHLSPGVGGRADGTYTAQDHAEITINGGGGKVAGNEYLVDGIPNTTANGAVVFLPSVDAVEELKVHTTMFDASLGHSNGGAISLATRSGTNDLHGTGYWYFRRPWLYANTWTNNRQGLPKTGGMYDQAGGVLSGPVWLPRLYDGHNRTFFTFSFERDRANRGRSVQNRVPTELERQGDFSQTLNRLGGAFTIYDPATTVVTGSTAQRSPFPGNRIPQSRFDPTGFAVMNLLPLPNVPGPAQIGGLNWVEAGYYQVKQGNFLTRIDHVISDRQRIFGRFGRSDRWTEPGQLHFPGYAGSNMAFSHSTFTNVGLDDTIAFSPQLVGTLRLGIVRSAADSRTGAAGYDPNELSLPDVIIRNQFFRGWPTFAIGESFPAIGSKQSFSASDMYSGAAAFTKLTGAHTTKFGIDYRLQRSNSLSPGDPSFGSFTFNSTFTRSDPFTNTASDTSGTGMASLLLGLPASGSFGYNSARSLQNHYFAGYIQNDWKVSRRLTINLGLRWELETPYTERYNRISYAFDSNVALPVQVPGYDLRGGILFAGVDGNPRRAPLDLNNFGPRFGFAFQPAAKTVLRGGYGIFYSTIGANESFVGTVGTFNAVTPYVGSADNGATPLATIRNPFPAGLRQPLGSSVGPMAQVGDAISFLDLNRVLPYNQQWQFSVQRELPFRIVVDVGYVGMHSLKGVESFDLNEKPDFYRQFGAQENQRVANPFYGVFPETSALGQSSTITMNRLWVRYPQFTSVEISAANTQRAIYHSFQAKVDKRLSAGLTAMLSYTGSKLIVNNMTSLVNERHYRTVSELDHKHVLRVSGVYEMPFHFRRAGWRRFADLLFGGWQLSAHYALVTGAPLSISHANGRPLRISNPKLSTPLSERLGDRTDSSGNVVNPYFDVNAFVPLANQYVVTPEPPVLNELRSPTMTRLNAQLAKSFPIRERLRLELWITADNVTNTPFFSDPGTNMSNRATFGVITSTVDGARYCMLSTRLKF